ncbi:hypothetical protein RYX36_019831 [Vicia faba]
MLFLELMQVPKSLQEMIVTFNARKNKMDELIQMIVPKGGLLKFIRLKRKYYHDYVKAFYFNIFVTRTGLESKFNDKLIKFDYSDFKKYLDLTSSGALVDVSQINYDKVSHVLDISKSIVESPGILNFSIIQVKFDMCLLH